METIRLFVPSKGKYYNVPSNKLGDFTKKNPDAVPAPAEAAPMSTEPSAGEEMSFGEPAAYEPPAEEGTTAKGILGGMVRGAAPIAGGAALGALMFAPTGIGIPAGAAAGAGTAALTQLIADPAMGFINWAAGTDYPMPSKALEDWLTSIGVPEASTAAERLVRQATGGLMSGAGSAGLARTLSAPATAVAPTFSQRVAAQLAQQPGTQAFAGGVSGIAGQTAQEMGGGPVEQMLASLGGGMAAPLAARAPRPTTTQPAPLATPSRSRELVTQALEKIGAEADVARVKTAGPKAVEAAEATGGAGVQETARVMREAGMGGIVAPKGAPFVKSLQKTAEGAIEDTNALIGRIIEEVDQQGAEMMRRADEIRAGIPADKVKAAEDAAKNADEIEAAVAAAEKRFADEKGELYRASTGSGMRAPAKSAKEPGIVRVDEALMQRRVKEAAAEAAQKVAAAKEAMKKAQAQERIATKGVMAPDPMTGEVALAPSGRDPLMYQARLLQIEADDAVSRANQLAEEARVGAARYEEPMPMRAVISANKDLQVKQRELDMVRAAAKKSREDATKLADESGVAAANAEADRLVEEANKRKVSGKAIADRMRAEMRSILTKQTPNTMSPDDIPSETMRKQYGMLEDAADRLERGGDLTLRQTYSRLMPIEEEAAYGRKQSAKKQARAETAKEQSRAIRGALDEPIEAALPAEGGMSTTVTSPYARVGRGAPIEGPVSGREAYGSFRRVGSVARDIAESNAAQLAEMEKLPFAKRIIAQRTPTGFEASAREAAQSKAMSLREPTMEEMAMTQGIPASFLEALRQIDEEAAQ